VLPDPPPMPALTGAEGELIDRYLDVVDLLGRINPTHCIDTYSALRAAQALAGKVVALREALETMHERGEGELHGATLVRAMQVLDGERRTQPPAIPRAGRAAGSGSVGSGTTEDG
jgi:hypothetical protein